MNICFLTKLSEMDLEKIIGGNDPLCGICNKPIKISLDSYTYELMHTQTSILICESCWRNHPSKECLENFNRNANEYFSKK